MPALGLGGGRRVDRAVSPLALFRLARVPELPLRHHGDRLRVSVTARADERSAARFTLARRHACQSNGEGATTSGGTCTLTVVGSPVRLSITEA